LKQHKKTKVEKSTSKQEKGVGSVHAERGGNVSRDPIPIFEKVDTVEAQSSTWNISRITGLKKGKKDGNKGLNGASSEGKMGVFHPQLHSRMRGSCSVRGEERGGENMSKKL